MENNEFKRMQELAGVNNKVKEGTLSKSDYGDDEVYYVEIPNFGNILLHNKLIDELGYQKLNSLIGKKGKWELIEFDYLKDNPTEKYRISKYLND